MRSSQNTFPTIRSEGGLLPSDLLQRLSARDPEVPGLSDSSYHLSGEKLNEAINRSWNRLAGAWKAFQTAVVEIPESDPATSVTREKWLLPLFEELKYGRLQTAKAKDIEGKSYPISHGWGHLPIHLVGCGIDLDRRTQGVAGASRSSPHSMVQECLNRSSDNLWAIVSNGLKLRVLRDNITLTRQAYLEFDLAAMFEGEAYSDFVILWLVCHQSRVEAENPKLCCLEKWAQFAEDSGTRALEKLRQGVEAAIESLGRGFLAHPANRQLREQLSSGRLDKQEYYRQLLRLIYRFIFLFVAEDRNLLLRPDASSSSRKHYYRFYSLTRLRTLAERRIASQHGDLWQSLTLLFDLLEEKGSPALGLPVLGSFLWSGKAISAFEGAQIANRDLLRAIYFLAFTKDGTVRRSVDYKNLGTEELGSIYEALLEMHPQINLDAKTFALATAAGNERKTTGSYYTPTSLVNCLLDSALDPVIAQAAKGANPEQALLDLKICDPACGSGHFLIAAAHRLAKRLATVRTGETEPSPEETRAALRDVIGRCIFGVDINPMAVELCKVSLWMEAIEPGKPLSFLDHHIQCGNSLLGTTPALISRGIPDAAYKPITGDDKSIASLMRKDNKEAREEGQDLFDFSETRPPWEQLGNLPKVLSEVEQTSDESLDDVHRKEEKYAKLVKSSDYENVRLLADAWCAAFVWPKDEAHQFEPLHTEHLRKIERNPHSVSSNLQKEVRELAERYQFLHWHIAFPQVFQPASTSRRRDTLGWQGGFDCVLGNPPWDMQEIKDNEFFASDFPEILSVKSAKEKAVLIASTAYEKPELWASYDRYCRTLRGQTHLIVASERFPLSASGRLNLYRLFVELSCSLVSDKGTVGLIIPSGFAFDSFAQPHFRSLFDAGRIYRFFDFENRQGIFPEVHRSYRFAALTVGGGSRKSRSTDFVFFAHSIEETSVDERHVPMSKHDLTEINPISGTPPQFRRKHDLAITSRIHAQSGILCSKTTTEGWFIRPKLMFMMNAQMKTHRTAEELLSQGLKMAGNRFHGQFSEWLPFYEGKMVGMYDHRAASVVFDPTNRVRRNQAEAVSSEEHADPHFLPKPMFWLESTEIEARCGYMPRWLMAVKDVTSATNERTVIGAILPPSALTDSVPWLSGLTNGPRAASLMASLLSFPCDFVARQKVNGLHLRGHYLNQLPVPSPETYDRHCPWTTSSTFKGIMTIRDWILMRVLELTYSAWDLAGFAHDCGYDGPPFRWNEERRFAIRCDLDAAFFHLYLPCGVNGEWVETNRIDRSGVEAAEQIWELKAHFPTPRDAVGYIMETFPIVKRKDERDHGHYRTKDTILEIYDAMLEAQRTGQPYQTRLDPPPGPPTDAEGNFIPFARWKGNIPSHIHQPQVEVEVQSSWRDEAFKLLAPKRVPIDPTHYRSLIVEALIKQVGATADFDAFRRSYWLLTEAQEFQRLGQRHLPEIPGDWWKSRHDLLPKEEFLQHLKGAVGIGQIRLFREAEERKIQWTGKPQDPDWHFRQVIDDARAAILLAELWEDEEAEAEWQRMDPIMEALFVK